MKIFLDNKNYPSILKGIEDAPVALNYRGDFDESIFSDTLAVVGSRRITSYGKRVVEEIVSKVAKEGVTIVSGFMYGVDAAAHRAALSVGGKTIAVMPCGVDVIHPAYQRDLYKEIEEKGLILSEFDNGYPPSKWTYPKRNRIVVGLSKAVLAVEAEEKSGTLISVNLAVKYKRKLFAVPGSIFNPTSQGTNRIIKEGLAKSVLSAEEILSFFNKSSEKRSAKKVEGLSENEKKVFDVLKSEAMDANSICKIIEMNISQTNTTLSILCLKGIVKKDRGRYYVC
ncbi:MAG: DNA-processing protein DprA [Candidatus Pacebacteria bacterium]|nr:DNA-processing protein DprA [Candidatus Paceibacterota bacterium]